MTNHLITRPEIVEWSYNWCPAFIFFLGFGCPVLRFLLYLNFCAISDNCNITLNTYHYNLNIFELYSKTIIYKLFEVFKSLGINFNSLPFQTTVQLSSSPKCPALKKKEYLKTIMWTSQQVEEHAHILLIITLTSLFGWLILSLEGF
jgi:hypothetical protein